MVGEVPLLEHCPRCPCLTIRDQVPTTAAGTSVTCPRGQSAIPLTRLDSTRLGSNQAGARRVTSPLLLPFLPPFSFPSLPSPKFFFCLSFYLDHFSLSPLPPHFEGENSQLIAWDLLPGYNQISLSFASVGLPAPGFHTLRHTLSVPSVPQLTALGPTVQDSIHTRTPPVPSSLLPAAHILTCNFWTKEKRQPFPTAASTTTKVSLYYYRLGPLSPLLSHVSPTGVPSTFLVLVVKSQSRLPSA